MVGSGVRSGGGPWDTVPTGLVGLRPDLLPSGRRGRCLLRYGPSPSGRPHTVPSSSGIGPPPARCWRLERWSAQAYVPGEARGTRSLSGLRACGPVSYPAAAGAAASFGRARVPRAAHTPCPAAQESRRRQPGAGDWNDGRPRRTFRGRPVGHGPYRACGPTSRSLTQRPLVPLPLPVGPESLGPPTHRAQQPRNRAATSQVLEIGTMVGPGVRSAGGPWDTVPTGGAGLRPGVLPSGRWGRCPSR